ncbi:MAG TPA: DUF72 domain-containing protein [Bryobacteraceae bacterium]|jgi:uncharacterized protein YecE (DUF72 family)|nr:DUF72 domain-containing protein [Bryobacteraceae bacterium]
MPIVIRVGVAGWTYKDWEGVVYPRPAPRGFDKLTYLADFFDAVEINSSYYGAPRATAATKWTESVTANRNFRFTAKLFHSFTHERKPAPNDEKEFKDGIAPLVEANRFGALLIQFPWSFRNEPESRAYVVNLHRRFVEYPLVIEVRHSSWIDESTLDLFSELGVGIANIDQPLFKRSVKPDARVTSNIGYVRLHGRNYKQWFSPTANVRDRYDHLYTHEELSPWIDRIKEIAVDAKDTYVIGNNHNIGKAAVNALELRASIAGQPVKVPHLLSEAYPGLREISVR